MTGTVAERELHPLEDGGELAFTAAWLSPDEAARAFATLRDEIDWKQRPIRIMGREVLQPRLTAWYGEAAYTYSGVRLEPLPWTPLLRALKDRLVAELSAPFNSVLLNLYRDGHDSMGLHSDDEKELGPRPVIASLSLGATRRFVLRHRRRRDVAARSFALTDGSLLVMAGTTQAFFRHEVPKDPRCDAPRMNLTFRHVVAP